MIDSVAANQRTGRGKDEEKKWLFCKIQTGGKFAGGKRLLSISG
jgi:hypothetical protein